MKAIIEGGTFNFVEKRPKGRYASRFYFPLGWWVASIAGKGLRAYAPDGQYVWINGFNVSELENKAWAFHKKGHFQRTVKPCVSVKQSRVS